MRTLRQRRAQGVLIKTLRQDYALSKASVYRYLNARAIAPTPSASVLALLQGVGEHCLALPPDLLAM